MMTEIKEISRGEYYLVGEFAVSKHSGVWYVHSPYGEELGWHESVTHALKWAVKRVENGTPLIEALSVNKPAQVSATATAKVRTSQSMLREEVIDFGLSALSEGRTSLFGYGVEGHTAEFLPAGTYVVFAYRD